jgi:hypothetical protein
MPTRSTTKTTAPARRWRNISQPVCQGDVIGADMHYQTPRIGQSERTHPRRSA